MKTKNFLTLLLLAVVTCLPAWADMTYQLLDQTNGTLTGAVRFDVGTGMSSAIMSDAPMTISGKDFAYYAQLSNYKNNLKDNPQTDGTFQMILAYDCKTTSTNIKAYVHNANAANKSFFISEVKEGETAENHRTETLVTAGASQMIEVNTTNTGNSTFFIYAASMDVHVYQIEVIESGEPLLRGGDPGYVLNCYQGRASFSPTTVETIDGIEAIVKSSGAATPVRPLKDRVIIKVTGNDYIGFDVAVPCTLRITTANSGNDRKYNLSQTKLDTDVSQGYKANSGTQDVPLTRGKWYMNAAGGKDVYISKLEFLPINYAITFDNNGKGTAPANVEAARVILNAITDGGIQLGWKANHDVVVEKQLIPANTLIAVGSPVCVMENTTFTAEWAASAWDVIFKDDYPDGQQIGETHQVGGGGYATDFIPTTDPDKANNVFKGWSVDGATVLNLATYAINANTTFYPVWNPIYTVNFKKLEADTDPFATAQVENGSTTTAPTPDPTREGYNFKGWSLNGTDIVNVAEQTISGNTTFLAVWKEVYDVTFEKSTGVQYGDIQHIEKGDYATAPTENPAIYGKIFQYWSLDGTTEVNVATTQINEATTFTAVWQDLPTYTVSFDTKGGSAVPDMTALQNEYLPAAPTAPTREGYAFQGWSETNGGDVVDITTIQITAPKTFYAVWEKVSNYKIFTLQVLTTPRYRPDEAPVVRQLENGTEARIIGGEGWVGTGDANITILENKGNNIRFVRNSVYVKLLLNTEGGLREGDSISIINTTSNLNTAEFHLTYNATRSTSISTTEYGYKIPVNSSLIGRNELYIWRPTDKNAYLDSICITRPDVDEHINHFVSLSFDTDGATSTTPETQKLLSAVWPTVEPAVPVKNYDIFLGWFQGDDEFTFGNPLAENVDLLAKWRAPEEYTIRFYSQGEPMGDAFDFYENQPVPAANIPADPQRAGYNFKGWSTDGTDANIKNLETYLLQSEVNFYAVWHKVINVTTDIQGVQTIVPYEENDYANLSSPTRNGYHFAGWKKSGEADLYDFSTPLTEDITLVAQWTEADPNVFTFSFNDIVHYDGFSYKSPEGAAFVREIVNNVLEDERALTNNPYTMFESDGGITSIVVNNGFFNPRARTDYDIAFISPQIKLKANNPTSNIVFTIKDGYEATLNITASGYDDTRTVNVSDAVPASQISTGHAYDASSGEMTFVFGAGAHTLTVAAYSLFVQAFTLTTTPATQNVKLADLRVNDVTVDGFSPLAEEFDAIIPYATANFPVVTYTASDPSNVTISECWYPVGTDAMDYVVTVTSKVDPTQSRDYTIHFTPGTKDKLVIVRADYVTNTTCTVTGKFKDITRTGVHANGDNVYDGGYKFFSNTDDYIHLAITGETFHEGDLLRVYITSLIGFNNGTSLTIYGNADGTDVIYATGEAGVMGLNTFVLPEEVEGRTDIYLKRVQGNTWNPYIRYAEVVRTLDEPVITSFTIADQEGVIDQVNKTINVELPPYTSYVQTPVITTQNNGQTFETLVTPTGEQDFSTPVTYTLTDKDGDTNTYTVNVTTLIEIGNDDNSALLSYYNGKNVNVNFTRPIDASNGDWYTLCLPFNMSAEQIEAAFGPCQLATLATSEWLPEANLARIRHSYVTAIEAGKPYLFLPQNSYNGDATIAGVTIDNTERPVTTTYVDFIGTFNPKHLDDDGYTFYLDDNNMLYHPWENMTLRATRCYYHFHNLTPAQMQNIMARVMIDGDANHTPTTVEQITADPTINGKYILNGQLIIIRDGIEYTAQGQIIK